MKRKIIINLAFLLLSNVYLLAQEAMTIHHNNGSQTNIQLLSIDSVTFTSNTNGVLTIESFIEKINSLESRINELEKRNDSFSELLIAPPSYYNNVMRSINRLGIGQPRQSIVSYKRAFNKGFRILLCDLLFTKDSIPVCFHDLYIGQNQQYVRMKDGSDIQMYPPEGERDSIHCMTYEELNEKYDFGIYGGEEFKGTKLLKLEDMLNLVKNLGCELYIEVKEMDEKQSITACRLVKKYGLESRVSWTGDENMRYVVDNIPTARVSTMPYQITEHDISFLSSLKTGYNHVFFFGWNDTILNSIIVDKLIDNEIAYEMGTIDDEIDLNDYLNKSEAYKYCTGIESNTIIAGKVLYEEFFK